MNVGAAEVNITPDFEVELSGFALRMQPATGVLDPIHARAVYLEDGAGSRLALLATDVLALEAELVTDVREWARRELGLRPEQVMLAATHTHSAPGVVTLNAAGARSERCVRLLRERIRDAMRRAVDAARPCEVSSARGRCDVAIDRRNKPTKHVDHTVWSIGFRESGGGPFVAAVLNYGMHPVALGSGERRISPDWCGGAAASLAQSLSRGAAATATPAPVVLVTNGAAGNVNPPSHGATREQVFAWGKAVADAVAESLRTAVSEGDPALAVRSVRVPMPLDWHDPEGVERVADEMIRDVAAKSGWPQQFTAAVNEWRDSLKPIVAAGGGRQHDIELQAARIGDVTVIAVNGEMFARFTDDVRRRAGTDRLFVVGYANAAFGYIPTREAYPEGGYEVDTAHYFYNSFRPAPGGLELLADAAADLVRSLDGDGISSPAAQPENKR
jgi:neutral ceramidase